MQSHAAGAITLTLTTPPPQPHHDDDEVSQHTNILMEILSRWSFVYVNLGRLANSLSMAAIRLTTIT